MAMESIIADAMQNFEILIMGAVVGYVAGSLMTKRKMKRQGMGGMGM